MILVVASVSPYKRHLVTDRAFHVDLIRVSKYEIQWIATMSLKLIIDVETDQTMLSKA